MSNIKLNIATVVTPAAGFLVATGVNFMGGLASTNPITLIACTSIFAVSLYFSGCAIKSSHFCEESNKNVQDYYDKIKFCFKEFLPVMVCGLIGILLAQYYMPIVPA